VLIIDDNNAEQFTWRQPHQGGERREYGLLSKKDGPYASKPRFGSAELAIIPMEEWPDRIADQERNKSSLFHIWQDSGIGILDQNGLSYCHAYSAAMGLMMQRALQGLPYVALSPCSIGGPVTGYRNAGAYIGDDLEQCVKVGCSTYDFVAEHQYRQGAFKDGWEENAALHKATEIFELEDNNTLQTGSALLQNKPVQTGIDWWGHAVTFMRLLDLNKSLKATDWNRYGIDFPNTWSETWGKRGWGVLTGRKAIANEQYIFGQVVASLN
jgi:hypothetical protein